jgi:GT2 family glycosyltransferase
VVVCVHNAAEETLACLRSLCTTSETPHTVHIVDDASDALVAARLDAFIVDKPWMRITRNAVNEGYTRSADKGVRAARSDWVVLLNSDTVTTPGWLEGLLEAAASDPAIAFVGPVSNAATFQSVPELYAPNQTFMVNSLPAGWSPADMAAYVAQVSDRAVPETPLLNGFCTLIRRSVFLELGGFNAGAFPAGYGEENDLCTRAVKAGHKLVVADHVYVHHHKSASFGGERRAELAKAGSRALKLLHPDVDYAALTAGFRDLPALVNLRAAVRRAYGEG